MDAATGLQKKSLILGDPKDVLSRSRSKDGREMFKALDERAKIFTEHNKQYDRLRDPTPGLYAAAIARREDKMDREAQASADAANRWIQAQHLDREPAPDYSAASYNR